MEEWVGALRNLGSYATSFPQADYSDLTILIQPEWNYHHRGVPGVGAILVPVEEDLVGSFLLVLLGDNLIPRHLRGILSLRVKRAGLGMSNPTTTVDE